VPGLDVALGVTAYQIAETAKAAASAVVRGRRIGRGLARALGDRLSHVWKAREGVKAFGLEISRHSARGAMHAVTERPLDVKNLVHSVTAGVVEASRNAGVSPEDAIIGTSQGIIQGAVETESDLSAAVQQIMETAREIATQTGLSEETAVAKAIEGALQAAEGIGPEAAAKVRNALPEQHN